MQLACILATYQVTQMEAKFLKTHVEYRENGRF
jgi:hypothetical protein